MNTVTFLLPVSGGTFTVDTEEAAKRIESDLGWKRV